MADPKTNMLVDDTADSVREAIAELNGAPAPEAPETPVVEAKPETPVKDTPAETPGERARGPDGKFAKKDIADTPVEGAAPGLPFKPDATKPIEGTGGSEARAVAPTAPPPGWSIAAKAEWDKLTPAVREAIAHRESEVSAGFKQYEGLKPFAERATRGGTTLQAAVSAYANMETELRRDPARGFMTVAGNLGLTQHQTGQLFSQLAAAFGQAPAPNGHAQPQQDYAQPDGAPPQFDPNAFAPMLNPLVQRLGAMEQTLHQQTAAQQAYQARSVNTAVERFSSDPAHRYFENVQDKIVQLFESGAVERTGNPDADLAKAYDAACWLNPEIRALLIDEQATKTSEQQKQRDKGIADKARAAARSISGPAAGGVVNAGYSKAGDDVEADARAAFRQHTA
jgi:hypothetical protein